MFKVNALSAGTFTLSWRHVIDQNTRLRRCRCTRDRCVYCCSLIKKQLKREKKKRGGAKRDLDCGSCALLALCPPLAYTPTTPQLR